MQVNLNTHTHTPLKIATPANKQCAVFRGSEHIKKKTLLLLILSLNIIGH